MGPNGTKKGTAKVLKKYLLEKLQEYRYLSYFNLLKFLIIQAVNIKFHLLVSFTLVAPSLCND